MEIILLVAVTGLLFGGKKFPQLMKGIGEGLKEFKKARMDEPDTVKKPAELQPPE